MQNLSCLKTNVIKEKKLPVVVLFEGWGASGIGTTLGKVIQNMDPRFYNVETMNKISEDEQRRPFLYRIFYAFQKWNGHIL